MVKNKSEQNKKKLSELEKTLIYVIIVLALFSVISGYYMLKQPKPIHVNYSGDIVVCRNSFTYESFGVKYFCNYNCQTDDCSQIMNIALNSNSPMVKIQSGDYPISNTTLKSPMIISNLEGKTLIHNK